MQISVLATKCRFCGEEVGKPKEEQRTLSIHDLGGEQVHHNAPSGSVLEAMESFRAEETLSQQAESDEFSASGLGVPESPDGDGSTPDFFSDESSKDSAYAKRYEKSSVGGNRATMLILGVVALALIVGGVVILPGMFAGLSENQADATIPDYVNRAPVILDRGGDPIEALEAAIEAIEIEDSAANRRIAEDVVAAIAERVEAQLNATPFHEDHIQEASKLASNASRMYPNDLTQELLDTVREDDRAYKMLLLGIEGDPKMARFQLQAPGSPIEKVKVDDMLAGRFQVRSFSGRDSVVLVDTQRGGRPVRFKVGGEVESP
jgi:hypothetical protein